MVLTWAKKFCVQPRTPSVQRQDARVCAMRFGFGFVPGTDLEFAHGQRHRRGGDGAVRVGHPQCQRHVGRLQPCQRARLGGHAQLPIEADQVADRERLGLSHGQQRRRLVRTGSKHGCGQEVRGLRRRARAEGGSWGVVVGPQDEAGRGHTCSVQTCLITGMTVLPNTVDCRSAAIKSSTASFSFMAPLKKAMKASQRHNVRLVGRADKRGGG